MISRSDVSSCISFNVTDVPRSDNISFGIQPWVKNFSLNFRAIVLADTFVSGTASRYLKKASIIVRTIYTLLIETVQQLGLA